MSTIFNDVINWRNPDSGDNLPEIQVNQGDGHGRTPPWIACRHENGESVKMMLKDGKGRN